eukprot:scaffold150993_cov63-Attheya_sp.AAC.1
MGRDLYESMTIPPFIAPTNWLPGLFKVVLLNAANPDSENPHVEPVAITWLSRGGKTRSLHELCKYFRHRNPEYAIIFVSFNSATPIQPWEKEQSMNALCLRIAFAASSKIAGSDEERGGLFDTFRTFSTADHQSVVQWLGKKECILIIDELNKVTMDSATAMFLKNNFLLRFPFPIFPDPRNNKVNANVPMRRQSDNTILCMVPGNRLRNVGTFENLARVDIERIERWTCTTVHVCQ